MHHKSVSRRAKFREIISCWITGLYEPEAHSHRKYRNIYDSSGDVWIIIRRTVNPLRIHFQEHSVPHIEIKLQEWNWIFQRSDENERVYLEEVPRYFWPHSQWPFWFCIWLFVIFRRYWDHDHWSKTRFNLDESNQLVVGLRNDAHG